MSAAGGDDELRRRLVTGMRAEGAGERARPLRRRSVGRAHGAAMESNHPTGGLLRPAGFEDRAVRATNPACRAALRGTAHPARQHALLDTRERASSASAPTFLSWRGPRRPIPSTT